MSVLLRKQYSTIKKEKLSEQAKSVLKSMYDTTDGFKDLKATRKIKPKFEAFYNKLKESKPEAIVGGKAKAATPKAAPKKSADDFKAARARRKKQTGVPKDKKALEKDAVRPAISKRGRRVSKAGNTYYEYRDNRLDKNPSKYPMLAKGGSLSYGDKFKEVEDLGYQSYYVRDWGNVINDNDKKIDLVVVASIIDLQEATGDDGFSLSFSLVPLPKFMSKKLLKDANDENTSVSSDQVVNVENYMGGLNYNPSEKEIFDTKEDAEEHLLSKELNDKISGDALMGGYILDNRYNRMGQTNWERLDYMTGVTERFAKGGEIEVGDKVKAKYAKYHATVTEIVDDVEVPYAKITYSDGMVKKADLKNLQKVELRVADEYVNPNYMAKGGMSQGYDDREDERLSMEHGKMSTKDLDSTHARRDDARFEERGKMAKGGFVSKGELVWRKLSDSKKMEFLYEKFTPQITPRSQEILVGKDYQFLPKDVKIKLEAKYANVEEYAEGGETAKFQVDDVVYHKQHNTIGIVRIEESRGEVKTDADGNVNVDELQYYNPLKHEAHKNAEIAPSTLKEIEERGLWNPFSERTSKLAQGGKIVGRNNQSGESYGVVIGSVKKADEFDGGGIQMNVRNSYDSRISESTLYFDNDGNLISITNYGSAYDGKHPSTGYGSTTNYNGNKKETLEVLSKKYNTAFAKRLIELAKNPKMAKGGMMEHGLRIGDKVTTDMFWDNQIVVENQKTNKRAQIDLETGKRKDEMADGGMMAHGGETHRLDGIFEDGGEIAEGNLEMAMSNVKAIGHHAMELKSLLNENTSIEAWVVAKLERAETDLSDVTHYIDGLQADMDNMVIIEEEFAKGGSTSSFSRLFESNEIEKRVLFVINYYADEVDYAKKSGNYSGFTRERIIKNYKKDLKAAQKGEEFDNFLFEAAYQSKMNGKSFEEGGMMAKGGSVGKIYYHILEYGDYGNIGYQGYYETEEDARKEINRLSGYFPDMYYEIFTSDSMQEPPITTMAKGGRLSRKQKQLDLNKNGKLDSQDFKMLRAGRKNARKK
jgi:hypothetical protein